MDLSFDTVNAYLALAAVVVNFAFAVLVMVRTSRSTVSTTFFGICLTIGFWNFCDFMVYASGQPLWPPAGAGSEGFWKYISVVGSGMAVAFVFHFANGLARSVEKNRYWIIISYVASSFLAFSSPGAFIHPGIKRFVDGVGWNLLFVVLLVPFLIWSIILVLRSALRADSLEERNRYLYIFAALFITIFAGLTDLVQKLDIPVPPLGHIGSVIGPSILAVGVFKYRRAYDILAQEKTKLEMLTNVARGVTHEVRNPLTAIKGLVNIQAEYLQNLDTDRIVEYQNILTEEIQRMEMILTGFQDFSKPLELEKESIDINNLVEKTFKLVILDPLNVWITLDLAPDIQKVQVDPSLLRQVFLNLIKNASEASGKEGKLTIRTESSSVHVKVSFTDNGPGIPEDVMGRMYEPFFSTKDTGIGLGLSIVRKIMDAHGGHIEVENVSPNGAKITLVLPR
ncbi:hypothetical protein EP232_03805 [bacterium]|nr:MAG: hypothetical protein EP232_03805 [bacterium]